MSKMMLNNQKPIERWIPIPAMLLAVMVFIGHMLSGFTLTDTEQARAQALFKQVRCQVCQGESVDESQSTLAQDMRYLITKQISQGKSDQQIKDFLVSRYGQSVLMETPMTIQTIWLWMIPALLIGAGLIMMIRQLRRQ